MSQSLPQPERHPRGLAVLFFAEMWERFSFYLMLGILPLYVSDSDKGGLGWSRDKTAALVGSYIALVYFTPFIGGLLADRLLGYRRTILIGGVLMMIGHLVLAWPTETGLYLGLGFIILGNGAFKPNISTLLGNLYPPGSKLKDAGYSIFYMGINTGSFLCNIVAALVRNYFDNHPVYLTPEWRIEGWHAAFSTASIGMLLGLLNFVFFYRIFKDAEAKRDSDVQMVSLRPLWVECLGPAVILAIILGFCGAKGYIPVDGPTAAFLGACLPVIFFYVRVWQQLSDPGERNRVGVLLAIFGVVIMFWGVFQLSSTTLPIWARDNIDRRPGPIAQQVLKVAPGFAENAPSSYYGNAGPDTPRPARDTLTVVSDKIYEKLKEEKKLNVTDGKPVYVTQKMLEDMERNTGPQTERLSLYEHLKLINTELFSSINPAYVVLLTPLVVSFFGWLRRRNKEPSTPAKFGFGLLFAGCGPLVMLAATWVSHDGATKTTAWWLFGTYLMATLGELCLSPMGLSLVNKLSPAHIRALMMGGWFVATSFGNKLAGIFGQAYVVMDHYIFWPMLAVACFFFAGLVFALLPWFKRAMGQVPGQAESTDRSSPGRDEGKFKRLSR